MIRSFFISLILLLVAAPAYAGVVINEVAWMGTTAANGSYCEWVELFNEGNATVDLADWGLHEVGSVGDILIMTLTKTIIPGGYYLIERVTNSCTDPVPGVGEDAGSFGGGGLSNSGEILILKNTAGAEVDRVDGSNNWAIGGNNTTKETLQKTSGGWATAVATPRAQNVGAPQSPEENNSSETGSPTPSQSVGVVEMSESVSKIKASAGVDRTALAGAEVVFEGSAEGFVDATADKIKFHWNFGDGKTGEGSKVAHAFSFPGAYEVFLTVSFAGVSVSDSAKITVVENPVVVSEIKYGQPASPSQGGWVELYNNSPRKIDFSNFGMGIGDSKPFYFPDSTFLSPWVYLALEYNLLGFDIPKSGEVKILYPNGKVLFSSIYPSFILDEKESLSLIDNEWVKSKATPGTKNEVVKISSALPVSAGNRNQAKLEPPVAGADKKVVEEINLASVSSQTSNFSYLFNSEYIWLFFGLGVGIFGGLALFFAKRYWA